MISFSIVSILIYLAIIYLPALLAAKGMIEKDGTLNNRNPRDQQNRAEGWSKRALAAHYNGFEMFPLFVAALVFATLAKANTAWAMGWGIGFLVTRFLYVIAYLLDISLLRSFLWTLSLLCCISLLFICL